MVHKEIYIKLKFVGDDWEDYADLIDDIVISDSGILNNLKNGVEVEFMGAPPKPDLLIDGKTPAYSKNIINDFLN